MSINETGYEMDSEYAELMESLQGALERLCPTAVLVITSRGSTLSVFAKSTLRDSRSIAKVLVAAAAQFYDEEW